MIIGAEMSIGSNELTTTIIYPYFFNLIFEVTPPSWNDIKNLLVFFWSSGRMTQISVYVSKNVLTDTCSQKARPDAKSLCSAGEVPGEFCRNDRALLFKAQYFPN